MKIDGGCHCGAIQYEAEIDPAMVDVCHCTDCQAISGAPYRVVVEAPSETFKLLKGEPKRYIKTADSGNKRVQAFCPNCGSPIYASSVENSPPRYNLRLGTIRQRAMLVPQRQQWCRSAMPWAMNLEQLPKSDRGMN